MIFVTVSAGHFDPLVRACARLAHRYEFTAQIGGGTFVPPFSHFRSSALADIEAKMKEAELVITHAGSEMLAMVYRLRKPCVIVPRQMRYGEANDLQIEVARRWGGLDMGVLCLDLNELGSAIETCREKNQFLPPGERKESLHAR